MRRDLRPLWLYPATYVALMAFLLVRAKILPPDPGRGMGDAYIAFFALFTVGGYGIGVQALANRLRETTGRRILVTAIAAVVIAPTLWFGAWMLASVLWMRPPWWLADLTFFFGPVMAGIVAVPMSLAISRPIAALGARRPAA